MAQSIFKSRTWEVALPLICFCFYAFCATQMNPDQAPDEFLRMLVPIYLYDFGTLPLGDDPLIVGSVYGTSYGFAPYGPSLVSALFMRATSLFTTDPIVLYISARFISCISGALMVFVCIRIGRRLFHNAATAVLLGFLIGFLPQLAFLASYLNNDIASACACAIVILAWVRGIQNGWDAKSCVLLGLGLGGCALTYYFGYAFILCSIPVFFISYRYHPVGAKGALAGKPALRMWALAGLVLLASIAFGGWFFIRNAIIYQGDIFGMASSSALSQQMAVEGFKPSNRMTLRRTGVSAVSMLFNGDWWVSTYKSFFGLFGYMQHQMPNGLYRCYTLVLVAAAIGVAGFKRVTLKRGRLPLAVALIVCIVMPAIISLYYSWSMDYQAQGRYLFSALAPLMTFAACGVETVGGWAYGGLRRVGGRGAGNGDDRPSAKKARHALTEGEPVVLARTSPFATALVSACGILYFLLFVIAMATTMFPYCLYEVTVPEAALALLTNP